VQPTAALAAWLHGVACRVALGARIRGARHRRREAPAADVSPLDPRPDPLSELTAREALQILDEEVQRLPQPYRLPVILCCLEGLSQEEAARQLGWTPGSLRGRLERGRRSLHQRLVRRGLELAPALGLVEIARGATADLAGVLRTSTAKAAAAFAAGAAVGDCSVPTEVATLTERGLRSMALGKAKVGLAAALLLGLVAASAAVLAHQTEAKPSPPKGDTEARRAIPPEREGRRPPHTDRQGDPLPPGAVAPVGSVRWGGGRSPDGPVVYAADGKIVASCDDHKAVRFLDTATGKELRRIEPPGDGYTSFAFAPDDRTVVTGDSRSPGLRLWEVSTGKELRQITGDKVGTLAVAFSPDGKTLAAMGYT